MVVAVAAGENLLVNGDFTAANPLEGWRTAFPHEEWYVKNHGYVRVEKDPAEGKPAVLLDLPPGVPGNQGGKIESAFFPAAPGAKYRFSVECMTWDLEAKLHVEAWVHDPSPGKYTAVSKFRVPARDGMPALIMCYRAQVPNPPGKSRNWSRVEREFQLPSTVEVMGETRAPEWISVKAVFFQATMGAGKAWARNFRLEKGD